MAKISISNILVQRHRIRIFTLLAGLLVCGFFVQLMIAQSPKQTKAATCTITPGMAGNIPANCEGSDIIIDGRGTAFTVYADSVRVWQSTGTHYECKNTVVAGGITYSYSRIVGSDCEYRSGKNVYSEAAAVVSHITSESCEIPKVYNNIVGPTPQYDPRCDSRRHFNSLTIRGGAILTHASVASDEVVNEGHGGATPTENSLADNTTGTGRWKQVRLDVEGDVSVDETSRIDVTAKGYSGGGCQTTRSTVPRGAPYLDCVASNGTRILPADLDFNGRGPGRGLGEYFLPNDGHLSVGAGAGYGGNGAPGGAARTIPGGNHYPALFDRDHLVFDFGSGGGGAFATWPGEADTDGGAGGGRIWIKASKIQVLNGGLITAKGRDGSRQVTNDHDARSGGGSGGAIILSANTYDLRGGVSNQASWDGGASNSDRTADEGTFISDVAAFDIYVDGGGMSTGAGGGGGRIVIIRPGGGESGASFRKTLWPVLRPNSGSSTACTWNWHGDPLSLAPTPSDSANSNCTFNPYSLRKGDQIEISMTISNAPVSQRFKISDQVLHNGLAYCDPIDSSASATVAWDSYPENPSGIRLYTFIVENNPDDIVQFRYTCELK